MYRTVVRRKLVIPTIVFCLIIMLATTLKDRGIVSFGKMTEENVYISKVLITNGECKSNRYLLYGKVLDPEKNDLKVLIVIYSDDIQPIFPIGLIGKTLSLEDWAEPPEGPANPRGFDYRKYLYSRDIDYVYYSKSPAIRIDCSNLSKEYEWVLELKKKLLTKREEFLEAMFRNDDVGRSLAEGILFGNSSMMDEDNYEVFKALGTAHVLAASGLHVGVIYGFYMGIFAFLKRKPGVMASLIFAVALFLYGTVAMWSPSIIRAVLLVYLKLLADFLGKRFDMLSGVCLVNWMILAFRPYMIYNAGFQMSFLAAYGISVILPRVRDKIPNILALPLAIQGFLIIYSLWNYNMVSMLAIPANILMVFLAGIYVPIGVIAFFVFLIEGGMAWDIYPVMSSLGNMMTAVNGYLFHEGRWTVTFASPRLVTVVLIMGLVIFLTSETAMVLFARSRKKYVAALLLVIMSLYGIGHFAGKSAFDDASMVFISVGQGDACHLAWGEDIDIIIDGGGRYDYNVGEEILRPYFLKNGVNDMDLALSTHEHMDHYKGLQELREVFKMPEIITYGCAGDIIEIDENRFIKILWPIPGFENSEDENYYSRIFMIYDHGIRTLITGDITEEGELAMVNEYRGTDELSCNILKIPHHGSRFSTSEAFIDATDPQVAVISVGRNNYGHPSPEVIEKLNRSGIIIYRTDQDGAVGVIVKEDYFVICTQKSMRLEQYKRT